MVELEANKEARESQERHIAELTEAVTSLMGQVKGQCGNTTPERSARATGGAGGRRPSYTMHGLLEAPLILDIVQEKQVMRRDEEDGMTHLTNENKQPAEKEKSDEEIYGEATEDEIRFAWALGKAIEETTKSTAQRPSGVEHAKHQDIWFWLTTCKDFSIATPTSGKTRRTISSRPCPNSKDDKEHPSLQPTGTK